MSSRMWNSVRERAALYEIACTLLYIICLAVRKSKASVRVPKEEGRAGYENIIEVGARTPNSLS